MDATRKNLKLLWWLRNLAILAVAASIKLAHVHFNFQLPYGKLWGVVALISFMNFLTWFRLFVNFPVSQMEFFVQLSADAFALFALLYFTGGASNPFATLFVLQVLIAATILSPIYSWLLSLITIGLYTALLYDKPQMHMVMEDDFNLHIRGMWGNFIILVILVNWFVARMNLTLRKKDAQLAANERMASLASLAVGAAHELGTPLGTINLLAENMSGENAQIILQQVARCKNIITEITQQSGAAKLESGKPIQLNEFVKSIITEWKKPHENLHDQTNYNQLQQTILADYGLKQAVTNLLDNAFDASPGFVGFDCFVKGNNLYFTISDHGKGIDQTIIKMGTTTKPNGLGMGIYLSQATVTRLGGRLEFGTIRGGTLVQIMLPLDNIKI